jgi:hypothetical protein
MKLEHFEKLMNEYRKGSEMISELHSIGFDLMEGRYTLGESLYNIFISGLETHYTDNGVDWVTWFMFENEWGEKDWNKVPSYKKTEDGVMVLDMDSDRYGATDEDDNPICYDIKSLWEYIEKEHKL